MLAWLVDAFTCQSPNVDETPLEGESPAEYVQRLANTKAHTITVVEGASAMVIGADTIVVHQNRLLGKPSTPDEARAMLSTLRGNQHQVMTAVTVLAAKQQVDQLCISDVRMRAYSDADMESYIASGDPLDKAGAYAIQHNGFRPVEGFGGCMASVMGLPLCHLARALRAAGLPSANPAPRCQKELDYHCPIWQKVMNGETAG